MATVQRALFHERAHLFEGFRYQEELDGAESQSIGLLCGVDASTLEVTASGELLLSGGTEKN
jgi:hypothetical protein